MTGRRSQPSLDYSRSLLAAAVVFFVAGCAVILHFGWILTRLDLIAGVVALAALAWTFTIDDREQRKAGAVEKRDELLSQFSWFVAVLVFYAVSAGSDTSPYNAHVRQAFALLHGHISIDAPNYIEHAQVGQFSYQLHPLLPSFVLMPVVAIFGMDTNQTYFSIVMGALDVALAWRLLGRFRLNLNGRTWLAVFFGAGTIVWYETVNGSSWAVSMVVAMAVTLAALDETFARGRPGVVGLFAGVGALARYDLAFVWPVYVGLLMFVRGRKIRELVWFAPGCALTIAVYASANFARYHSVFDQGVRYYMPPDQQRLFGFSFFPGNLYTLLFMAPGLNGDFPYIYPRFTGQSILLTSPAFLLALKASCRRRDSLLVGVAALIAMTPSLFYVGNGSSQFGTRHFLQVFPFLLVLMAIGAGRRVDQMSRILIGASVFLITWGVWYVRMHGLGPA